MRFKVRMAQAEDMDTLNRLTDTMHQQLASLYGLKLSPEELEEEHFCKGELESVFVAEDSDGNIVGYLSFSRGEDEWVGPHLSLDHLSIDEEHMGLGVGRDLCNRLMELAKAEGLNISTGSLKRNERALKLYRKLGFKPYSERLILDLQQRLFRR